MNWTCPSAKEFYRSYVNYCNQAWAGRRATFASQLWGAKIESGELLCWSTGSESQALVFLWQWEYHNREKTLSFSFTVKWASSEHSSSKLVLLDASGEEEQNHNLGKEETQHWKTESSLFFEPYAKIVMFYNFMTKVPLETDLECYMPSGKRTDTMIECHKQNPNCWIPSGHVLYHGVYKH